MLKRQHWSKSIKELYCTTRPEEFENGISLWKRIKCFPPTQQSLAIFELCLRTTRSGISHDYRNALVFEKLCFKMFSFHTKTMCKAFSKSWTVGPIVINDKAAFSNSFFVVWTLSKTVAAINFFLLKRHSLAVLQYSLTRWNIWPITFRLILGARAGFSFHPHRQHKTINKSVSYLYFVFYIEQPLCDAQLNKMANFRVW